MDRLHSATLAFYFTVWLMLVLTYQNLFFLLALILTLLVLAVGFGMQESVKKSVYLSLPVFILIIVINVLVNEHGQHVLAVIPWPGGTRNIYMEALAFGLTMSAKLLALMLIFVLVNRFLKPDRLISLSGRLHKPALMLALSFRLIPHMQSEMGRVFEVMRMRGINYGQRGLLLRVRNLFPLVKIALRTSLDGAIACAEAMQARAYGAGPRSHYVHERWRMRDYLVGGFSLLAAGLTGFRYAFGIARYDYSAHWLSLKSHDLSAMAIIVCSLMVPAVIEWGCQNWPYLNSRI